MKLGLGAQTRGDVGRSGGQRGWRGPAGRSHTDNGRVGGGDGGPARGGARGCPRPAPPRDPPPPSPFPAGRSDSGPRFPGSVPPWEPERRAGPLRRGPEGQSSARSTGLLSRRRCGRSKPAGYKGGGGGGGGGVVSAGARARARGGPSVGGCWGPRPGPGAPLQLGGARRGARAPRLWGGGGAGPGAPGTFLGPGSGAWLGSSSPGRAKSGCGLRGAGGPAQVCVRPPAPGEDAEVRTCGEGSQAGAGGVEAGRRGCVSATRPARPGHVPGPALRPSAASR